ncbi:hypothetical protein [Hyphococcus luteus]|nr:hypothetical protein [Marinicaulis flavus]
MSGWDRDRSGDYTPAPPPRAFWILVAILVIAVLYFAVFAA